MSEPTSFAAFVADRFVEREIVALNLETVRIRNLSVDEIVQCVEDSWDEIDDVLAVILTEEGEIDAEVIKRDGLRYSARSAKAASRLAREIILAGTGHTDRAEMKNISALTFTAQIEIAQAVVELTLEREGGLGKFLPAFDALTGGQGTRAIRIYTGLLGGSLSNGGI